MEMNSSSGEEDGDPDWKAAIDSVSTTTTHSLGLSNPNRDKGEEEDRRHQLNLPSPSPKFSHYQKKVQKVLSDILEKSLVMVKNPIHVSNIDSVENEGGIKLFKNSHHTGIVFDHVDEFQLPTKRPRIIPGKEIDEKSKEFKRELKSVVIDGEEILAKAREACQKSQAKLEARDAASKVAAKKEEERVAELKRIRGERWLPAIAREMGLKCQRGK